MASSSDTIILTHPEDWESWLWQLRGVTDKEIWPHIDPDEPAPEQGLLEKPIRPEVGDFDANATTYAQLSAVLQKTYENSRRYYDQDMKYYFRQEDLLRTVRTHITTFVSTPKRLLLDPTLTVREWLVRLKEDTEPTMNFMRKKAQQQYEESLKGLKLTKISKWLDRWEHAMKMAEKHNLPHMSNGIWLQDLAEAVRPLSETYFVLYTEQANDPQKSRSSEYRKVAMKLREAFANLSNKTAPSATVRGSAFNVDFAVDSEEDNSVAAKGQEIGRGNSSSRSRKRAGTNSNEGETSSSKKSKTQKCLACDMKGHTLPHCWYLFEDQRPEGFKASGTRMKKVLKKVKEDKELAAEVEKLKLQEGGDSDEA
jgi:hypothetical protein